jgi:hypothetical protein
VVQTNSQELHGTALAELPCSNYTDDPSRRLTQSLGPATMDSSWIRPRGSRRCPLTQASPSPSSSGMFLPT